MSGQTAASTINQQYPGNELSFAETFKDGAPQPATPTDKPVEKPAQPANPAEPAAKKATAPGKTSNNSLKHPADVKIINKPELKRDRISSVQALNSMMRRQ